MFKGAMNNKIPNQIISRGHELRSQELKATLASRPLPMEQVKVTT